MATALIDHVAAAALGTVRQELALAARVEDAEARQPTLADQALEVGAQRSGATELHRSSSSHLDQIASAGSIARCWQLAGLLQA